MKATERKAVTLVDVPTELMRPDLERRLPTGSQFKDLTGYSANGVELLGFAGWLGIYSTYLAKCDCGDLFLTRGPQFVSKPRRCGKHRGNFVHGHTGHPLYYTYAGMITRCVNPKCSGYKHYGGRGIKVCSRWLQSFDNFLEDIGERPSPAHSIDRKDNDGDYEPSNCRWATRVEQAQNKGDYNRWFELNGERMVMADWADRVGVTRERMRQRVNKCEANGVDPVEAITTPPGECMPSFRNYHITNHRNHIRRTVGMIKDEWFDGNVHVLAQGKDFGDNVNVRAIGSLVQAEAKARGGKCKVRVLGDHIMFVFESKSAKSAVA